MMWAPGPGLVAIWLWLGCSGGDTATPAGDSGPSVDGGGADGGGADGGGADGGGADGGGNGGGDGGGGAGDGGSPPVDADKDGYGDDVDCDDTDPSVHPGAVEVCNTVDDDCDLDVDEDVCTPFPEGTVSASTLEARVLGVDGATAGYWGGVAGDVDGDGVLDLLNGTVSEFNAPPSSGVTYVIKGPVTATVSLADVGTTITGHVEGLDAWEPARAGDVNADGFDDVLVRSNLYTYLVLGPISGTTSLASADGRLPPGDSPEDTVYYGGVGDINGDGRADVMTANTWVDSGDNYLNGEAWLFLGPVTGTMDSSDADATLVGYLNNAQLGYRVEEVGDMNGDGFDEVAVSDYWYESDGAVFIQYGPLDGTIDLLEDRDAAIFPEPYTESPRDFSSGADVDGDGLPDIVVGSHKDETTGEDAGAAFFFRGPVTGDHSTADADSTLLGPGDEANVGGSVEIVEDMDLDGAGELAVTGFPVNMPFPDAYSLYLFHGPIAGSLSLADADLLVTPASADGWFGISNLPLSHGDVTGDGYPDLVFGAPTEYLSGIANGVIWILPGGP